MKLILRSGPLMAVLTALLLVIGNPSVSWTPAPALARGMTDVHRISVDSSGMVQMKDVVAVLSRYLEASSGPVTAKRGARERVIGATGKHVIKRWNMTFRTCGVSFETTGPFLVVTVEADKPSRAKRYYRRMVSRLGEGAQASPRSQTRRTQQSSSAAPAKLGIARIPESRPAGMVGYCSPCPGRGGWPSRRLSRRPNRVLRSPISRVVRRGSRIKAAPWSPLAAPSRGQPRTRQNTTL